MMATWLVYRSGESEEYQFTIDTEGDEVPIVTDGLGNTFTVIRAPKVDDE